MVGFKPMEGMAMWARASAPRAANRANSPARAGAVHLSTELPVILTHIGKSKVVLKNKVLR